jgi:hypothetical protein
MLSAFPIPALPEQIVPGAAADGITGWMRHKTYAFCYVSMNAQGCDRSRFWCDKCVKWLALCNSSGNVGHHVASRHRDSIVDNPDDVPILDAKGQMLMLLLENDLPFRIVESPRLRSMTGITVSRQLMSKFATQTRAKVQTVLTALFSDVRSGEIALTFDEWTDARMVAYLGIKVHSVSGQEYKVRRLSHFPFGGESATGDVLAETITKVLNMYRIRDKILFAVTDGASLMGKTIRLLGLAGLPCWCHILNLMLGDILKRVRSDLNPIFDAVNIIGKSTKFLKLVENCQFQTLATYCQSRWYSLWKFLRNGIALHPQINEFLKKHGSPIVAEGVFNLMEQLFPIVETFKNASEMLESAEFGSLSHVLQAYRIVEVACVANKDCAQLWEGWQTALNDHWKNAFSGEARDMILLAMILNPGIPFRKYLSEDDQEYALSLLKRKVAAKSAASPRIAPTRNLRAREKSNRGVRLEDIEPRDVLQPQDELAKFLKLNEETIQRAKDNLFQWWVSEREHFPVLYQIAVSVLVVPASSAAAERQFSLAKRIYTDKRNQLKPNKLQALVLLADNLDLTERVLSELN